MISAIVLAAGLSQRMGRQKLVLPFNGQPLIVRVVDELLRGPIDQVCVVIGKYGADIKDAIGSRSVQFIINSQPESEMLQTVRAGLSHVHKEATGAMIVLGDQPDISAEVVTEIVRSFHNTERQIVVPTFNRKRGHPLLVAKHYFNEILTHYEGQGLRGLLEAHPHDILELEVSTPHILEDIDVPEDYLRWLARNA